MPNIYQTVQHDLLTANGLSAEMLAQSLSLIGSRQVDYADIYCQRTAFESWHLEEGMVKSGSFQIDQGVGVRAVAGEKTAFAYADSLNAEAIGRAAEAVRVIGAAGRQAEVRVPSVRRGKQVHVVANPIASLDSAAKVALLNKVEALAKAADPRIVQVMAGLTCEYDLVYVARLDGKHSADIRPLVRLSVTVIAKQGERREQGSAGGGGRFDLAYFDEKLVGEYVQTAVQQALINLEARPAPAGAMTVVLGSGWPGVLLHEAVGHGLEGDFNRKQTSAFAGRIGERVAAKGVTVNAIAPGPMESPIVHSVVSDEKMAQFIQNIPVKALGSMEFIAETCALLASSSAGFVTGATWDINGGIYMYPPNIHKPNGKLRLMCEAAPLAFLAEQAGGKASDGRGRILERVPDRLHARTPLFIGSAKDVEAVEKTYARHTGR